LQGTAHLRHLLRPQPRSTYKHVPNRQRPFSGTVYAQFCGSGWSPFRPSRTGPI
jgi:hypothetical protein